MAQKKLGSIKLSDNVLVTSTNLATEVTGTLGVANGGTGQSVYTNGQLLIGNTTGNTLTKATLTAGSGISITNGAGSISIAVSTPVTSATNLAGGSAGTLPYQSAANTTVMLAAGTSGQVLRSNGAAAPSWQTLDFTLFPLVSFKEPAVAATTAALTVTATSTTLTNAGTLAALVLDAITLANGDRVLVKNQATASQNGIYTVTNIGSASVAWVLTRSADADTSAKIAGAIITVKSGTVNGGVTFDTTFKSTDTLATTAMVWAVEIDSANVSSYAVDLTSNQTIAGTKTFSSTISGSVSGSAATLATIRSIWGQNFNGSANVTGTLSNVGGLIASNDATATPTAIELRGANGSGTDIAGATLTLSGGRGTGAAKGGGIFFQTATGSTTGTTLNAAVERMRISPDGDISIGGVTPQARLHVVANSTNTVLRLERSGTSAGSGFIYANSGEMFGVTDNTRYPFQVRQSAPTDSLVITSAGNVGIGTGSPLNKLHIEGASGIRVSDATGSNFRGITFGATGGDATEYSYIKWQPNSGEFRLYANTAGFGGFMSFYSNNAEAMRITSSGNVGINTTTPGDKLDVVGNIRITNTGSNELFFTDNGQIRSNDNNHRILFRRSENVIEIREYGSIILSAGATSGTATNSVFVQSDGNFGIGTTSPTYRLTILTPTSDATVGFNLRAYTTGADGDRTVISRYTSSNNNNWAWSEYHAWAHIWKSNGTERMRLDASGNVGIGVTSMADSGHLYLAAGKAVRYSASAYITPENNVSGAEISTGGVITFKTGAGPTERARIDASGNLGVGTSSPGATVHAVGSIPFLADRGTVTGGFVWQDFQANGVRRWRIRSEETGSGYPFDIQDASATVFRIAQGGNVGIGTTSPSLKLHVAGDVQIGESSGGEKLRFVGATNKTNWQIGKQINVDNGFEITPSTAAGGTTFSTPAFAITNSGNVGIGTTSPSNLLHLKASSNPVLRLEGASDSGYVDYNGTRLQLSAGGGAIYFVSGNSEKSRLTSAGDWFVGTTTSWSSARFVSERNSTSVPAAEFNGTGQTAGLAPVYIWNNAESGSTYFISFYSDGVLNPRTLRGYINYRRDNATLNLTTASDYRIKTIHGPYTKSGEVFDKIRVHDGTMHGATMEHLPMVVAHELEEAVPYAVEGEKDAVNEDGTPKLQMVSYTAMIPLMLAEIKSLRARVAELEAR